MPVASDRAGADPARIPRPSTFPVYVVGGGPGGLAVAAALGERGAHAVVLEKSGAVGATWRRHYDRLHLHTTRALSALPGLPIPRRFGRWVARDDVVRYLEGYARYHELDVVTGVEVTRIDPASGGGLLVRATGGRELRASAVVVATGYNHTPRLPEWPGLDSYTGRLLHASDYRDALPHAGKDVLVVGAGNTGAELAVDLAEGGAGRVRLAVRTPPHILRRSTLGWPSQRTAIAVRRLPRPLVDRMAALLTRVSMPDLAGYGLPRPAVGLATRARQGAIPVQDPGLVRAVQEGRVEVVAAVEAFEGDEVLLADGTRITPEVVVAATGYRRGLDSLVGHLGVLDERGLPVVHGRRSPRQAPGLYFLGFTTPITGTLRELALDARRIARAVARRPAVLLPTPDNTPEADGNRPDGQHDDDQHDDRHGDGQHDRVTA